MNRHLLTILTFTGVILCMAFFVIAFSMTRSNEKYLVPTVNVTLASDANVTNITNNVFFSERYQEKLKTILHDRETIVKMEHEQFRAELGTWLSIFGLLSILATIMVVSLAYTCQQTSLKYERTEFRDEFNRMKKEIFALVDKGGRDIENLASQQSGVMDYQNRSRQEDDVKTLRDASAEKLKEDSLEEVQEECKKFVKIWPHIRGNVICDHDLFSEKTDAGIKVLQAYNRLLKACKGREDKKNAGEEMKTILCKMHLVSIYLGNVKDTDFYKSFVMALKKSKPLELTYDEVKDILNSSTGDMAIIAGYYRGLHSLQE